MFLYEVGKQKVQLLGKINQIGLCFSCFGSEVLGKLR